MVENRFQPRFGFLEVGESVRWMQRKCEIYQLLCIMRANNRTIRIHSFFFFFEVTLDSSKNGTQKKTTILLLPSIIAAAPDFPIEH